MLSRTCLHQLLTLSNKADRTSEETRCAGTLSRVLAVLIPHCCVPSDEKASQRVPAGRPVQELLLQVGVDGGSQHSLKLTEPSYSYSYDLTNSLQVNLTRNTAYPIYNTRFMWNYHLLAPAFDMSEEGPEVDHRDEKCSNWVLPFVHGFVDQASMSRSLLQRARRHAEVSLQRCLSSVELSTPLS